MTEADWFRSSDPLALFQKARGPRQTRAARWMAWVGLPPRTLSERKLRLFLCGWFRLEALDFTDDWADATADVLDAAERAADGDALPSDITATIQRHWRAATGGDTPRSVDRRQRGVEATSALAVPRMDAMSRWYWAAYKVAAVDPPVEANVLSALGDQPSNRLLADWVRAAFGSPFRTVEIASRWKTANVVGLASGIYEDRAFDRLPILADALQDAGCEEDLILTHARHPGPHYRGDWLVDAILGHG